MSLLLYTIFFNIINKRILKIRHNVFYSSIYYILFYSNFDPVSKKIKIINATFHLFIYIIIHVI